mmetsp:Transcript_108593/g.231946  ORF Transcript_108593/g.231946 Transcript_108593/m.231946 type:complete len:265 (-) Transcript_108593:105-899(-)
MAILQLDQDWAERLRLIAKGHCRVPLHPCWPRDTQHDEALILLGDVAEDNRDALPTQGGNIDVRYLGLRRVWGRGKERILRKLHGRVAHKAIALVALLAEALGNTLCPGDSTEGVLAASEVEARAGSCPPSHGLLESLREGDHLIDCVLRFEPRLLIRHRCSLQELLVMPRAGGQDRCLESVLLDQVLAVDDARVLRGVARKAVRHICGEVDICRGMPPQRPSRRGRAAVFAKKGGPLQEGPLECGEDRYQNGTPATMYCIGHA